MKKLLAILVFMTLTGNACAGWATLSSGTVTVSTTCIGTLETDHHTHAERIKHGCLANQRDYRKHFVYDHKYGRFEQ